MVGRWRSGLIGTIAIALVGCGAQAPEMAETESDGGAVEAPAAAKSAPIPGTPEGGLSDWVADIQRGIADLPARVAGAPQAAQQQALDLYIGRQEFIELYYGAGGRLAAGEALELAIEEAEARFHALMQLLGATPPPAPESVKTAVEALSTQLDRVVEEARAAGVSFAPPAGVAS